MNNILWLASWYPSRTDSFDGDFIERHALAVSRFTKLTVLFVVKDETLKNNAVEIIKTTQHNLTVYKVYYGRSGWGAMFEKILSLKKYISLQKKIYGQIVAEEGTPTLVHVHVAMKAGLLALWLKKKFNIPFLVTEHWSGYNPATKPNIYQSNRLYKKLNKKILNQASLFLPVSDNLGKMVNLYFTNIPYRLIPNVVNTSLFYYQPLQPTPFRFIHPSFMIHIKNPEGILMACKIVKERGYPFKMLLLGSKNETLVSLSNAYGLSGIVLFTPPVPHAEVARQMQQSSALLMFSRFENLPCVIMEALCCGLPIISSRVGGIPEMLDETNSLLVTSEDTAQLADAMIKLMETYNSYNRPTISANAIAKYNYNEVGRQIMQVYNDIL